LAGGGGDGVFPEAGAASAGGAAFLAGFSEPQPESIRTAASAADITGIARMSISLPTPIL
jgi:hypothetical protein